MMQRKAKAAFVCFLVLAMLAMGFPFSQGKSAFAAEPGKLVDEMDNYSLMSDHDSGSSAFATDAPDYFGNDASRFVNAGAGSAYAVYRLPKDMTYFTVDAYEMQDQSDDQLKLYTSVDGTDYTELPTGKSGDGPYEQGSFGFESGTSGWGTWLGTGAHLDPETQEAQEGSHSLRMKIDASSGGRVAIWHDMIVNSPGNPAQGDTVKLTGWIKLGDDANVSSAKNLRLFADYFDQNGTQHANFLNMTKIPDDTAKGAWFKIESSSALVPADAAKITIAIENDIEGTVYADNIQVMKQIASGSGGWSKSEYHQEGDAIPANTRYLKVELNKAGAAPTPGIQIGRVEIGFQITPPTVQDTTVSTFVNEPITGTLQAADTDNGPLAFAVKTAPKHGQAAIDAATGAWTYTPQAGYIGQDSFEVLVKNTDGAEAVGKVTVEVKDLFRVESMDFTDNDGQSLAELAPSGSVRAHMVLRNNQAVAKTVDFITALYDGNGAFVKKAVVQKTIGGGEAEELAAGFDLPGQVEGYYVSAFVWNGGSQDWNENADKSLMAYLYRFPYRIDFESATKENFVAYDGFSFADEADAISGVHAMKADTNGLSGQWNEIFYTAKGVLKPSTDYIVSFDYKIMNMNAGANAYFLFRSKSLNDTVNFAYLTGAPGEVKHVSLKISIQDKDDYSLIFGILNKGAFVVDNIAIQETSLTGYVPASRNAHSVEKPLVLPVGPPKIKIDRPADTGGPVVNAADFGVSESSPDNYAAFTAAIAYSKDHGASKLTMPKGIYHIRSGHLDFGGFSDFVFDGRGSELIFGKFPAHVDQLMLIRDCQRVVFKNFVVDWNQEEDPVASLVQVSAVGAGGEYVDFKFSHYSAAVRNSDFRDFLPLDPQSLTIGVDGAQELTIGNFKGQREWVAEDTVRLRPNNNNYVLNNIKVGNAYALRHYVYDTRAVEMNGNVHLTLSNVVLYSIPGMGFLVGGGQHHWQLLNCKVTRRPGSDQIMSSTADHYHALNTKGYFIIDGCDFGYGGDDGINSHDNVSKGIVLQNANTFTVNNEQWKTPYKAGDVIEFRNADLSPTAFSSKITNTVWNGNQATITLENNFPDNRTSGVLDWIVFDREYDSGNYIIRNNYFHENRARGVLIQSPNGLIQNNRFYKNEQPGMQIETGYDPSWAEGYGATNVIIRGNTFDSTNVNTKYKEKKPAIYMSVYLPSGRTMYGFFRDILIEGNTFKNFPGVSMFLSSSDNVIVKDNIFVNDGRSGASDKIRGGIYAEKSSSLTILNNTWIESDYMRSYGLYYEKETTAGFVFEGNAIKPANNGNGNGNGK